MTTKGSTMMYVWVREDMFFGWLDEQYPISLRRGDHILVTLEEGISPTYLWNSPCGLTFVISPHRVTDKRYEGALLTAERFFDNDWSVYAVFPLVAFTIVYLCYHIVRWAA